MKAYYWLFFGFSNVHIFPESTGSPFISLRFTLSWSYICSDLEHACIAQCAFPPHCNRDGMMDSCVPAQDDVIPPPAKRPKTSTGKMMAAAGEGFSCHIAGMWR